MSAFAQIRHRLITLILVGGLIIAAAIAYPRLVHVLKPPPAAVHRHGSPLFKLIDDNSMQLSAEAVASIGLKLVTVEHAPAPEPLRLPGYLLVDPNTLVPIHSRFPGQVVQLGTTEELDGAGQRHPRPLRFGDDVKREQLLAMVWSTDIGQKKGELVDALSKLKLDQTILNNYLAVGAAAVPPRQIDEAKRNVEADKILVNSALRTLKSWRLTDEEINEVVEEAKQLRDDRQQTAAAKTWSELPIRAPTDGVLLEKNVNVGEVVDTSDNLFKIANLSSIQVLAYVYEEDLPAIEHLSPAQRNWKIDLKSDPNDQPRPGKFSLIGSVIDQTMRTAPIVGWLDNHDRKLRVNQFVTATIELPADPAMVNLPVSALFEEGDTAAVFVETSADPHQVTRRIVAVTRRGEKMVFVRAEPNAEERKEGALPLKVGERVVMSGVLALNDELTNLKSSPDDEVEE
ncbi:MAG TPA: efflux RND transporter periplasmic adaptor subunit [Pirellulales bacterium]|nr:efflux RND transporter periplasmic adaptor subunit [Pirellulales bacterium]